QRLAGRARAATTAAAAAQARQAASVRTRPANRLAWLAAPALAAVLLAGVGTAAAANQSLPGDTLYPVKRFNENAQVFVSPSAQRGFVYTGLVQRRLDEVTAVAARPNTPAETLAGLFDDMTSETTLALAQVDSTPADAQASLLDELVHVT